jgi:riboflavin biosynthesis pyrimidine reductase
MQLSQLWPQQRSVEIERYVEELNLIGRAAQQRPFTMVNFIASIDGRASVNGRSGPLGDEADKELFRTLRSEVDAVLVGTGTLATERYGRMIRDPAVRERRRQRGMRPEPLACTLTRRGSLPLDIPLFVEPEAMVVAFAGDDVDTGEVRAQLDLVRMQQDELTFAAALAYLRGEYGVRALLCEGGPRVFAALAAEGLVDQLFLTISPMFVGGGDAPAISSGAELVQPAAMVLEGVLERQGTLFLRYAAST